MVEMSYDNLTNQNETNESQNNEKGKKLTAITATLFVAGENCGAALLALPFAMKGLSWYGIALIVICGVNSAYAGIILAKSWLILESRWDQFRGSFRYPYPAIGLQTFGSKMRIVVSICMHITLFGSCVVLLLLCSEIVHNVVSEYTGICFCYWILILAAILCPLMWLGTPGEFWPAAAGALGTTSIAAILLIWEISTEFKYHDTIEYPVPTAQSVFLAIGTVMFAYGGTAAYPTFQNDMNNKSKFRISLIAGYTILLIIYIPFSTIGYYAYGGKAQNDIISTITDQRSIRKLIAEGLLAGHLFFAILLCANPPTQEFEDLFGIPKKFGWQRVTVRVIFLVAVVIVGESLPQFGKILNLLGGSTIAMLSFILPPIFYLKLCSQKSPEWEHTRIPWKERIFLFQIIVFGAVGGAACTYSAIQDIFSPDAFTYPCYINSSYVPH